MLKQMDRILSLEQDVKRAQMTLMVRIKNTLTAQQQESLRATRPANVWFGGDLRLDGYIRSSRGDSARVHVGGGC